MNVSDDALELGLVEKEPVPESEMDAPGWNLSSRTVSNVQEI